MNSQMRKILRVIEPQIVLEGAGVKLRRSIATPLLDYLDPFLLFDHFGSDNPSDYLAGFPMHPHRGIETVTYMLDGMVNHRDSIGNSGIIEAGDVQWMTSGRGIMHEEMPQPRNGKMEGFQLWVNLPAKMKMTAPRYQEIASEDIPEIIRSDGVKIRVVAGNLDGVSGPVKEIVVSPTYLDMTIPENSSLVYSIDKDSTAFAYVIEGEAIFEAQCARIVEPVAYHKLIVFGEGDYINVLTKEKNVRFLLISGKPIFEPIARFGPFVMNTREEIEQALRDLREGKFV